MSQVIFSVNRKRERHAWVARRSRFPQDGLLEVMPIGASGGQRPGAVTVGLFFIISALFASVVAQRCERAIRARLNQ